MLVKSFKLTEPPVTMSLTAAEVDEIASDLSNSSLVQDLKNIPCHTRAVERLIALSTQVSQTYPVEATYPADGYNNPEDSFEQEMSNTLHRVRTNHFY